MSSTSSTPALFEIDQLYGSIFMYCSQLKIDEIHSLVINEENRVYWQHAPVVLSFGFSSFLTTSVLQKCGDIIEMLAPNVITVSIQMIFDVYMHHIEQYEVQAFCDKILRCAQQHALKRLLVKLDYKHCDVDNQWHQCMHALVVQYMMMMMMANTSVASTNMRMRSLSMRPIDFILYWKMYPNEYKHFLNALQSSSLLSGLDLEFGSLFKMQLNHSTLFSDLFRTITENRCISRLSLRAATEDHAFSTGGGYTQNEEQLTSLLGGAADGDAADDDGDDEASILRHIHQCLARKKIATSNGGVRDAYWKGSRARDSVPLSCEMTDFALRVHAKYGLEGVLNALAGNQNLCVNVLAFEGVRYDHDVSAQDWDDPFANDAGTKGGNDTDSNVTPQCWRSLLALCQNEQHCVEALQFEHSTIGKIYCQDLQAFFRGLIHSRNHIQKLVIKDVSRHATDVFMQYVTELLENGLSQNPMLCQLTVLFEYIGNQRMFERRCSQLIEAVFHRLNTMLVSQFAIEEYLRKEQGLSVDVVRLILQLCRHPQLRVHINETGIAMGNVRAAPCRRVSMKQLFIENVMQQHIQQLADAFVDLYEKQSIQKYALTNNDDEKVNYTPSKLMGISPYLQFVCVGDVCFDFGPSFDST